MKKLVAISRMLMLLILMAASAGAAASGRMSVQVRQGVVRERPSFLARVVTELPYGTRVDVTGTRGVWYSIGTSTGRTGWMHKSALTRKRLVMRASGTSVDTSASRDELALAGKGFNKEVEAEFRGKNRNLDFTWIDRMEKITIAPSEISRFVKEGDLKSLEGGTP